MGSFDEESDPKIVALQTALQEREPLCTGICALQDHQRILYYTDDTDHHRRIDFSNAGSDDLDALYGACKRTEFGEKVFDEVYRKAGKMDPTSFSTLLDPRSLGIHDRVSKALLTESHASMEMEPYKLNVYGKDDFFGAHKETQRGQNMFGSLVIIFPTLHEGGQFVFRQGKKEWTMDSTDEFARLCEPKKEWTIDFTDKFASATVPSVCFVAFRGNIEHEVLLITSGYHVTLTYNLLHKPVHSATTSIPTSLHMNLRQALADLVNDTSKLPNGGYFGFGLVHEYVHTGRNLVDPLLGQLKGSDRMLADACDALGLRYSIRLLYREVTRTINLLTTEELDVSDEIDIAEGREHYSGDYLKDALEGLTHEQVEGVVLDGEDEPELEWFPKDFKERFYKSPITEVLEVTPMKSSVDINSPTITYGNEASLNYFYGTACMVISVEAAESRQPIGL